MRQFRFKGNPADYRWDFPLTAGTVYSGARVPYRPLTIAELYDSAVKHNDKEFLNEWEEIPTD